VFGTGPTHASIHNISKNQLMNMYGFCRTKDLGKRDFYFSCKIQHTKIYTVFAKVLVLFSGKLAKLVSCFSNFSLNFYTFYKILANHSKLEESYLYTGPWNIWIFTKVPLTLTRTSLEKFKGRTGTLAA
jgi:hypothetical protein